jgi:hypothetical protein
MTRHRRFAGFCGPDLPKFNPADDLCNENYGALCHSQPDFIAVLDDGRGPLDPLPAATWPFP